MPRKKLQRFAELDTLPNVVQKDNNDLKKKLAEFIKNNKLVLELGCGRGEYTIFLAKLHPDQKFIGIDIQGERIWYGAKQAAEEKLDNIMFVRMQIEDLLEYFPKNSISKIWITFPDPYPRDKQIKKRLTSPRFLAMYKEICQDKAEINLKTDDKDFFLYSKASVKSFGGEILEASEDIYRKKYNGYPDIQTYYEKIHLKKGKKINYLKFKLN